MQAAGQGGQTATMGYNPYRRYRARPFDIVLVVGCLIAAAALLVWAFTG